MGRGYGYYYFTRSQTAIETSLLLHSVYAAHAPLLLAGPIRIPHVCTFANDTADRLQRDA